ncbi:unnamed protein product [Paramecium octaurelia]|uniref:H-type lectin domain-containing protein n=1 Tax=Paramecium octaurelia TaxID=43137 RepID=A0A8S1STX6_PAROT|nr:unnamed protein product [Paramecium octaurelia]
MLDGNIVTTTIPFIGTFANVPQVIISLEYLDMGIGGDFRVQTQNINQNSFDLHIVCVSSVYIWKLKYQWYAIDDSRIQVINNFNMVNIDDKTFDHLNPNANFGIVSYVSMGLTGNIDFKLSITQITTTKVTVGITKIDQKFVNLNQIGYQVILGTQEAFSGLQEIYRTTTYSSGTLTQIPNRWLFITYSGLEVSSYFRERFMRTEVSKSYILETWGDTFIVNFHQRVWLAYQFTTEFKAFWCLTLRISQSLDMQVSQKPQIYIDISELNQSFLSSQYLLLEKTVNLLSFKIYMKCIKTKTIVSQFLKCQSCSTNNKYHSFSHYCHGQIDAVTYFPKFQLIESSYKEINIYISLNSIKITQTLFNQIQSTETLLEIKFNGN